MNQLQYPQYSLPVTQSQDFSPQLPKLSMGLNQVSSSLRNDWNQKDLQSLMDTYCLCGTGIKAQSLYSRHNEGLVTRNIIQNQTSKTNLENLDALKGYPYSSYYKSNKSGKMVVMYKCEYGDCDKEFMRTWNLLDHIRMHYGIKPYQCQYCDKSFTQKGNMRKHLIQHSTPDLSERKKYKCNVCGSSFTERYNYRSHMKTKHNIYVPKNVA